MVPYAIGITVCALAASAPFLLFMWLEARRDNQNLKAIVEGFRVEPTQPSSNVARDRLRVVK